MRIKVVRNTNIIDFERTVNSYLDDDWRTLGNMIVTHEYNAQRSPQMVFIQALQSSKTKHHQ